MSKVLSLNELLSEVKRAVSGAVQKPSLSLYNIHGILDVVIVVKGGYVRFCDNERADMTIARLCKDWYSDNPSFLDYAKLNAEQRRAFIDYLAFKSFEECCTVEGFYWIQEVGADKDAARIFNHDETMDKCYTSQPFYLL